MASSMEGPVVDGCQIEARARIKPVNKRSAGFQLNVAHKTRRHMSKKCTLEICYVDWT